MGRMNEFNLWLTETGRAEHHPLTDELVMIGDNNLSDPSLWEMFLADSNPDKGVWIDDEDEDDLCDMSASHPGVYIDDDGEDDVWFEENGGLTAGAWEFLAQQDRNGNFV